MGQNGLETNVGEEPIENEIPDPPPEDNNSAPPLTGSTRLAMSVQVDPNEIPDPPPEDNN